MANTYTSDQITNKELLPPADPGRSGALMSVDCSVTISAALTQNDIIKLVELPPYCVPVDVEVYMTDLDTASSLEWDLGVLDTTNAALVSSSLAIDGETTVGQAAGLKRMDFYDWLANIATYLAETDCPELYDGLPIAIKVITAPGTGATGTVKARVTYRSTQYDG